MNGSWESVISYLTMSRPTSKMNTFEDCVYLSIHHETTLMLIAAQLEFVLEQAGRDQKVNLGMLKIAELRLGRILGELTDAC